MASGECVVKIKEITEGVLGQLARSFGGEENYRATKDWLDARQEKKLDQQAQVQKQAQQGATQAAGQFIPNPARVAAPAAAPAPGGNYTNLDPEIKVIKAVDPVILQFNNKRYTLQPSGQWTKLGQTKPLDLPTQQFLSSELAKL